MHEAGNYEWAHSTLLCPVYHQVSSQQSQSNVKIPRITSVLNGGQGVTELHGKATGLSHED